MPLYLTIVCLLLSYMYECSLVNLLMEEIKIKKKKRCDMLDSKLQSLGSLGSKAKQIVANVAKYFLQESKKETSPASYIRRTVEATGG